MDADLRYACIKNDIAAVKQICEFIIDVDNDSADKTGTTALMLACYYGNYEIVHELVFYQRASVNYYDENEMNALHYACDRNHLHIAKILLEKDISVVNAQSKKGWTAIHYASEALNYEMCKILISAGASPLVIDIYGKCAIDIVLRKKKRLQSIHTDTNHNRIINVANKILHMFDPHNGEVGNEELFLSPKALIRKPSINGNTNRNSKNGRHERKRREKSMALEKDRMMRNEIFCMKNAMHEMTNDYETEISELKERVSHVEESCISLKQMFLQLISKTSIGKPTKTKRASFVNIQPSTNFEHLFNDMSNDNSSLACFRTKDQDALSAVYYDSDEEAKYERPQYLQPKKELIKHEENSIEIPVYDGSSTERANIEYLCRHSQSPHRIRLSGVPEGIEKRILNDDNLSYSYNLTPMDGSSPRTITGNCLPVISREYNNHLSAPLDIDSPSINERIYDFDDLSPPLPTPLSQSNDDEPLPQQIEKAFARLKSENHIKRKRSLFENGGADIAINISRSSTVGSMFVDKNISKSKNIPSIERRHYSRSLHQNKTIYEDNIYSERSQKRKRKSKRKIQKQYQSANDTYTAMEGIEDLPAVSPPIYNGAKSQQVIRIPTYWQTEHLECKSSHIRALTPNIEFSMSTSERQMNARVSHHKKTRSTTAVSDYMQPLKNRKKLRSFKPMPTLYTSGILRESHTNSTLILQNENSLKVCMNPKKHHLEDSEQHSSKCCSNGSNSPSPFVDDYTYISVLENKNQSENEKTLKHIFAGVTKKRNRTKKYKLSRKSVHI